MGTETLRNLPVDLEDLRFLATMACVLLAGAAAAIAVLMRADLEQQKPGRSHGFRWARRP